MRKDKIFDELLVLQCQHGNKKAFELIIKRWNKKLISFAYKFTKDLDVAKDIVQESWISIFNTIGGLKKPDKLGSWLFRVTYNKTIDHLRKQKKNLDTAGEAPEIEITEPDERWETVEQLLKRLPSDQKTILNLFYLEEYTIKEIAKILQIKEGTVKSRIFYARETLKKKYKEVKK